MADCTKMVDFSGIQAHAQPIRHHFRDEAADGPGGLVFRGQGVPVGHEVVALIIFLETHPVVQGPVIVPQVHLAGGAHAAQDALCFGASEDFVRCRVYLQMPCLFLFRKVFNWWHRLSSLCGRRLKPATTNYEAYGAILTQAPIFWPKTSCGSPFGNCGRPRLFSDSENTIGSPPSAKGT